MTAPALTVYSTPTCGPCVGAKRNLDSKKIAYKSVDLTEHPDILASLKQRLGLPKVNTPLFEYKGELHNITELTNIVADIQGPPT